MASSLRTEVLSLYRKILRTCARWEAKEPTQTPREKSYILAEVRELFRKNKHVQEEGRILQCLQEGEARLEMAIHYGTPYPRPVNLPPMTLASKAGKGNKRRKEESRPIYIKSIDTN